MCAKHSSRRANSTSPSNAPIKPANQTPESNAPQSGSNFIYTKIAGRAAIGLYLHKESYTREVMRTGLYLHRDAGNVESDFLYTKNRSVARLRCDFLYTKNRRMIKIDVKIKNRC